MPKKKPLILRMADKLLRWILSNPIVVFGFFLWSLITRWRLQLLIAFLISVVGSLGYQAVQTIRPVNLETIQRLKQDRDQLMLERQDQQQKMEGLGLKVIELEQLKETLKEDLNQTKSDLRISQNLMVSNQEEVRKQFQEINLLEKKLQRLEEEKIANRSNLFNLQTKMEQNLNVEKNFQTKLKTVQNELQKNKQICLKQNSDIKKLECMEQKNLGVIADQVKEIKLLQFMQDKNLSLIEDQKKKIDQLKTREEQHRELIAQKVAEIQELKLQAQKNLTVIAEQGRAIDELTFRDQTQLELIAQQLDELENFKVREQKNLQLIADQQLKYEQKVDESFEVQKQLGELQLRFQKLELEVKGVKNSQSWQGILTILEKLTFRM